jgi:hypothetical protein
MYSLREAIKSCLSIARKPVEIRARYLRINATQICSITNIRSSEWATVDSSFVSCSYCEYYAACIAAMAEMVLETVNTQ